MLWNNVLLIVVGIAQMIQIAILIMLLKSLDKPDLSKEDATVKESTAQAKSVTDDVDDARGHLPPQN